MASRRREATPTVGASEGRGEGKEARSEVEGRGEEWEGGWGGGDGWRAEDRAKGVTLA